MHLLSLQPRHGDALDERALSEEERQQDWRSNDGAHRHQERVNHVLKAGFVERPAQVIDAQGQRPVRFLVGVDQWLQVIVPAPQQAMFNAVVQDSRHCFTG